MLQFDCFGVSCCSGCLGASFSQSNPPERRDSVRVCLIILGFITIPGFFLLTTAKLIGPMPEDLDDLFEMGVPFGQHF